MTRRLGLVFGCCVLISGPASSCIVMCEDGEANIPLQLQLEPGVLDLWMGDVQQVMALESGGGCNGQVYPSTRTDPARFIFSIADTTIASVSQTSVTARSVGVTDLAVKADLMH